MSRAFVLLFAAAAAAATNTNAQRTVSPPLVGFVEDAAQVIRPAYGVAGNFVLGSSTLGTGVSFASSGSYQLIQTDSAVTALTAAGQVVAAMNAPSAGPMLFSFAEDGTPCLAYSTAANELFQWSGGRFQAAAADLGSAARGVVVSIASPDSRHAALIVERGEGLADVRISLDTGLVDSETALTGMRAPALMLSSGVVVYTTSSRHPGSRATQAVVIRRTDGSEIEFPVEFPAGLALEQMGAGWVELLGEGARYAIRTAAGHEGLYRLPEAQP